MQTWMVVVLICGAVGYTILRRSIGEPVNLRDLFVAPAVLVGVGLYSLKGVTAVDIGWLVGTGIVGLALGMVRGSTVCLMVKDGSLWQRYPARTYGVWAVSLVVNAGLGFLATHAGMHEDARPIMLSIGIGLLGESAAVGLRGLATGVPFSPQRREDQRGLPNRSSFTLLDRQPALRDGVEWLARGRA